MRRLKRNQAAVGAMSARSARGAKRTPNGCVLTREAKSSLLNELSFRTETAGITKIGEKWRGITQTRLKLEGGDILFYHVHPII
jgi:hypothetical protein